MTLSKDEIQQMVDLFPDNYKTGELKPLLKEISRHTPELQKVINAITTQKKTIPIDADNFFHVTDEIIIHTMEHLIRHSHFRCLLYHSYHFLQGVVVMLSGIIKKIMMCFLEIGKFLEILENLLC